MQAPTRSRLITALSLALVVIVFLLLLAASSTSALVLLGGGLAAEAIYALALVIRLAQRYVCDVTTCPAYS